MSAGSGAWTSTAWRPSAAGSINPAAWSGVRSSTTASLAPPSARSVTGSGRPYCGSTSSGAPACRRCTRILMGAPGERPGLDQRDVPERLQGRELGHRRSSLLARTGDPHPRAAGGDERRIHPGGAGERRGDQREVPLRRQATLEGEARRPVGGRVQREEHDAGGVAVQPVDDPDRTAELGLEPGAEGRPALRVPSRDDRHACRLVDGEKPPSRPEDGNHSTSSAERTSTGPKRSSWGRSRSAGPTTTVSGGSGKQ